jgi:hypothetical protein
MMREVVGAFDSFSKLSEALEELCTEGIASDRVRVAAACAPPSSGLAKALGSPSAATHWRSAEYAGHGEHLGVVEFHDFLFETTDSSCDQAAAYTSGSIEDNDHATLTVSVNDNVELHAVCSIFSRLGTVDIDEAKFAA